MNYTQRLDFYSKQLQRALNGLAFGRTSKNYPLIAMNGGQIFKCSMVRALNMWRVGSDPSPEILFAFENVSELVNELKQLDMSQNISDMLPVHRCGLAGFLVGRKFNFSIERPTDPLVQLDKLLLDTLVSGEVDPSYSSLLERLTSDRNRLLVRSYALYFEILKCGAEGNDPKHLIDNAKDLFLKRATDSVYKGGDQTEGGGEDNDKVVDYRLGAIMKHVGYVSNSFHDWIW